jgi:hypothetical protein
MLEMSSSLTEFKQLFVMRSSIFSAQLKLISYCCTHRLVGLNLNMYVNRTEIVIIR